MEGEDDGIKFRLPFKIFSTLPTIYILSQYESAEIGQANTYGAFTLCFIHTDKVNCTLVERVPINLRHISIYLYKLANCKFILKNKL